jgi:hypothetical protein
VTARKGARTSRRRPVTADTGQWISVPPPWHPMDAVDEAIVRARYLAVRDLVGQAPIFREGERRVEWVARMGADVPWFGPNYAARFDRDPDVRQSVIADMLEADRRAVVGEHDDRRWRTWSLSIVHSVVDPRLRLGMDGKRLPADVVAELLERLRVWGAPFGVAVTADATTIVGEMPDDVHQPARPPLRRA